MEAGVKKLGDIIKTESKDVTFYTLDELSKEYSLNCNFLEFLQIKKLIPFSWLQNVCNKRGKSSQSLFDRVKTIKKVPKFIYNILLRDIYIYTTVDSAMARWSSDLNSDIEDVCSSFGNKLCDTTILSI